MRILYIALIISALGLYCEWTNILLFDLLRLAYEDRPIAIITKLNIYGSLRNQYRP